MTVNRIKDISSFIVMDVLERAQTMAREGISVIHLEVGEPDFETPACIRNAAREAIENGATHYTHSLGDIELRQAICEHYRNRYGVDIVPDQVLVCSGTSPALLLAFSVLLERGDEVIVSDPHYACYPNFIRYLEAVSVTVPVHESDGFQYSPDAISDAVTPRTKAVVINSPCNPTGTLLSPNRLQAIAELPVHILSDEIYHGLVYGETEHSILEYTDRAFVFNGFSKLYAMTGFRLGYVIAPLKFMRNMQKLQQNFFISASAMSQKAGIAALRFAGEDVDHMRATYDKRRRYMIRRLREMGFGIAVEPTGAFYVFANAKHLSENSYALAYDILENAHVGVTPGIDFGKNGEGYLRFSYANSLTNIREGMDRIERYLDNRSLR